MRVFYAMSGDIVSPPSRVSAVSRRLQITAVFQGLKSKHGTQAVIYNTDNPVQVSRPQRSISDLGLCSTLRHGPQGSNPLTRFAGGCRNWRGLMTLDLTLAGNEKKSTGLLVLLKSLPVNSLNV